jgi:glucose-1-phosphate cytidylyltransferase
MPASSACGTRSSTYIEEGDELVEKPFQRLIERRKLACTATTASGSQMDTFKDKITFDRMEARGNCPWMVWRSENGG